MALSGGINAAGFTPTSITAKATVTLEPVDGKPTVSSSHLEVTAVVPGMDAASSPRSPAEATKGGCPISRALNTKISLDAKLA